MGPAAWPPSSDRPAQAEDFATGTVRGGRIRERRPRVTRPALAPGPKAPVIARPRSGRGNLQNSKGVSPFEKNWAPFYEGY